MNGPAWHAGRITRLLSHLCNTWQSCDVSDVQVACLSDSEAHLALDPKDSFAIQTKPHGHGDVHALLHTSGLLKTWQKAGVKWVAFFQDTNGLVFRALPAALGALLPIPCLLPVLHLCSSTLHCTVWVMFMSSSPAWNWLGQLIQYETLCDGKNSCCACLSQHVCCLTCMRFVQESAQCLTWM